ncbi:MAG TPA: hypothetical protein VGI39_23240 [Polyangiaceae bacterium]|jgi:hypothetical protein
MNPRRVAPARIAFDTSSPLASLAAAAPALALLVGVSACSARHNDPPENPPPAPLGTGERIRDITNPNAPTHAASGATVSISGATYLLTDTFDETSNGKSKGTIYLQDVGSVAPFSGISLFSPTFNPADLALAPGDVLTLQGQFVEEASIGAATFGNGEVLIQMSKPVVQFEFDGLPPQVGSSTWAPAVIQATDLDDYNKGLQWEGMLVTIQNVTFLDNLNNDGNGRYTAHITSDGTTNGPTITNELFDLNAWNQAQTGPKIIKGTTYKSITGVVTWFFNFHLAPRSPNDIVEQ